jgi:uncharacterized protein YdaL
MANELNARTRSFLRGTVAVALAAGLAVGSGARRVQADPLPVLILYDSAGTWGYLGGEYALMLQNLLGHFSVTVTSAPVNSYTTGGLNLNNYAVTFYVGSTYDEATYYAVGSPERIHYDAFVADAATTTKQVVWVNHNLWQMAWNWNPSWGAPTFADKFGIEYVSLDSTSKFNRVSYKNTELYKGVVAWANPGADLTGCTAEAPPPGPYACDTEMNVVRITNPAIAHSRADAYSTFTPARNPYVTQAVNLWMLGDLPFVYLSEEDRYLAFADLLHDILGINHADNHRALIRLEDITAKDDVTDLNNVFAVLTAQNTIFTVAAISRYVDPLGYYNGGVPEDLPLSGSDVGNLILSWQAQGQADVSQEGTTHQWDSVPNPYTGVSGDDAEFYRVLQNPDGSLTFQGPVPGDSSDWASATINAGQLELANAGLSVFSWFAPHYLASVADYTAIRSSYQIHYGRLMYFAAGSPAGRFLGQFYPYTIESDTYGYRVLPENIASIEPTPNPGYRPLLPADLIRFATKALVVRDGFASFFYNINSGPTYLDQTITGIKGLGYTFVGGATVFP